MFLKNKGSGGEIVISSHNKPDIRECGGDNYYRWIKIELEKNTDISIEIKDAEVSVAYLCGNENIMSEGVRFLEFSKDNIVLEGSSYTEFYDTPYREQYHFVPIKNWVNDPNGLCWYNGYYHLFYQANPHKQEWSNMYWGHAASTDLIHWKHLPYVLEPQEELYRNNGLKGGAFSGSAVAEADKVIFYLTRHKGPQEDGADTLEWQTMTSSKDMISFEEEEVIIDDKPDGVGHDFRDPKVSFINGKWYLVLACNYKGSSAMLLYSSEDKKSWKYLKPVIIEPDKGSTTFECPDFFTLDNKQVGVAALMRHHDDNNRYQMTRYYIGTFENEQFEIENTGWFDFGSNYYAVQSFEHDNRRIAIGWVSDFYNEHIEVLNGAYGSFAIPRVLSIKNSKLYMEPVTEIYNLKDEQLYKGANAKNIYLTDIKGNSYYVKISLEKDCDFNILLSKDKESSISLIKQNGITKIKTAGVKSEEIDFTADVKEVYDIEIFTDRRLIEVFLNKGEAAGAKLFYNSSKAGIFKAAFESGEAVKTIEVYTMKSIWK